MRYIGLFATTVLALMTAAVKGNQADNSAVESGERFMSTVCNDVGACLKKGACTLYNAMVTLPVGLKIVLSQAETH